MKIRAAIVTVSDTRNLDNDLSGLRLGELLSAMDADIAERLIISDDLEDLRNTLYSLTQRDDVDLIVTTGGTGFSHRDNTPEATRAVIEREAPGLAEAMRRETAEKTPMSMLSRGVCGIRGTTLIINLPGSPRAVEECIDVIRPVLFHALKLIKGNTNHDDDYETA